MGFVDKSVNLELEHSAYEMAQMGKFGEYTIWVYGKEKRHRLPGAGQSISLEK